MKKLSNEVEEVVVSKRHRIEGIQCDICKNIITPTKFKENSSRYFEVTTGHNDWGNDSYESIHHADICPNCIVDYIANYIQHVKGSEYFDFRTNYILTDEYKYE